MTARRPDPVDLLGLPVHPVTMQQAVLLVEQAVHERIRTRGEPFRHVALNAAKVVLAADRADLADAVRRADLVTADGVGVLALARRVGVALPERVTGIDLMDALCARAAAHGWGVSLLGGRPGVAEGAATALVRRYRDLRIVGTHHGFFEPEEGEELADRIAASGARMLFVGMNTPRKELFGQHRAAAAGVDFVMGVGGAFDVLCGRRRRAPRWLQGLGLEWAYRWAQEPLRLAPRYGLGGLRFARRLVEAEPIPGSVTSVPPADIDPRRRVS